MTTAVESEDLSGKSTVRSSDKNRRQDTGTHHCEYALLTSSLAPTARTGLKLIGDPLNRMSKCHSQITIEYQCPSIISMSICNLYIEIFSRMKCETQDIFW